MTGSSSWAGIARVDRQKGLSNHGDRTCCYTDSRRSYRWLRVCLRSRARGRTSTSASRAERRARPLRHALADGEELRARPRTASGPVQVLRQHAKGRMTVWERIEVLQDEGAKPDHPLPELGPEPRRRLARHRGPAHQRPRRRALRARLHACAPARWTRPTARKLANLIYLAGEQRHAADRHERQRRRLSCRPASAASTATPRRSRRCARSAASCRASCACSATTPAAARTCRARAAS